MSCGEEEGCTARLDVYILAYWRCRCMMLGIMCMYVVSSFVLRFKDSNLPCEGR